MPASLATAHVTAEATVNWPAVLCAFWAIGSAALIFSWWRQWRGLRAALREASPLDLQIGMQAMISPAFAEPGVFGVRRPVLLLPAGITDRLTPPQLKAVVAHEQCHVRRRDNLATAIHMGVEALFWFHPLVWWLGARLMEERERACDEEVLLMGSEPAVYAEGILKICELYLESSMPCVSGVTGANLRKRIEEIMSNRTGVNLSSAKKAFLAIVGISAVAVPTIIGVMNAPSSQAQTASASTPRFEVTSVKPCEGALPPGGRSGGGNISPGRLTVDCQTVKGLITTAYVLFANGQHQPSSYLKLLPVEGGPGWINSERYSINAKAEDAASPETMQGPMMQALLEDRFKLKIHRETKEVPIYAMTMAKGGLKLKQAEDGSCTPRDLTKGPAPRLQPGQKPYCGSARLISRKGSDFRWEMHGMSLDEFSKWLNLGLDRLVFDKTGVTGKFDFQLEFASDDSTPGMPVAGADAGDAAAPSIFSALQQQLGLKLEPAKGPGEFFIIDHVERPAGN